MGKSPGKWIKTVIFGKKSSKSTTQNQRKSETLEKEGAISSKTPSFDDVALQTTGIGIRGSSGNVTNVELVDEVLPFSLLRKRMTDEEEQAAITAQAILRGYLARRFFRAIKGIVRLQALIRGHLVRRQAVATLSCVRRIVRFQALSRGRRVRLSDVEIQKKCASLNLSGISITPRQDKLSSNAFICKLLVSSQTATPLHLQYDPSEPNYARQWLERWSSFEFWGPIPQKKKEDVAKKTTKKKKGNIQIKKSDLTRLKQVEERVSNLNNRKRISLSDLINDKQITGPRELDVKEEPSQQDQPRNDLERVKQNLRRISASSKVVLNWSQSVIAETPKLVPQIASSSPSDDKIIEEKTISPTVVSVEAKNEDSLSSERLPLKSVEEVENLAINAIMEDEAMLRSGQRDVPRKLEYTENVPRGSPARPNYMMSTKSTKAKLRGFGSLRFDRHEAENDALLRRSSLPLYDNRKSSLSSGDGFGNNKGSRPGWRR